MWPLLHEVESPHTPETLAACFKDEPGLIVLRSSAWEPLQGRYSLVVARPFLRFVSRGAAIEVRTDATKREFGDPWRILEGLMQRYELLEQIDLPFPLGGCFGFWGYDLKNFVEPRLPRTTMDDLALPHCSVGFYDSVVVFDHRLGKTWVVSTGLQPDGSRTHTRARQQAQFWREALEGRTADLRSSPADSRARRNERSPSIISNRSRQEFMGMVERARAYIRNGDIYQVNLAQRLAVPGRPDSFKLFENLAALSPAPFSAYIHCGEFQLVSSSPEAFLRMSGASIQTRPIKGTRPRGADPTRDAQLAYELQTSPKEVAELIMITDLLRNDLGRVCEYGSVQVPELVRLEKFAQVQHLVSTVTGHLREDVSHLGALARCFPGGSVTGAPKIRAMEIIDELEPVSRGPYTGCLGYVGFNRESQLSMTIRAAVCKPDGVWFHAGAGIVADSDPAAEYDETWAKAGGFVAAIGAAAAANMALDK